MNIKIHILQISEQLQKNYKFYDLSIKSIDGEKIDFKSFKGKNVLICVREVSMNDKNPYDPTKVKQNIENLKLQ